MHKVFPFNQSLSILLKPLKYAALSQIISLPGSDSGKEAIVVVVVDAFFRV